MQELFDSHALSLRRSDLTAVTFELYTDGDSLYDAMLRSIAAAREEILLECYIFSLDEVGQRFVAALRAKAAQGITVRVQLDAAGSLFWQSRRLSRQLRQSGVQLKWFHRWDWRRPWRYNRRDHRKLLVVDGRCAFLGGFNIHRQSSRRAFGDQCWRDTHIRFDGYLASEARHLFMRFWVRRKRPHVQPTAGGDLLMTNYMLGARRLLNGTFASMLSHARESILITTPYFVPERRIRRQIVAAATRGVDVRLLIPGISDVRLAQWAARAVYDKLLADGVRIYEYQPRLLHAKTIVVDNNYATVGTANLDYRSFLLNYELNLFTRDRRLCEQLVRQFHHDLDNSREINAATWARRPRSQRVLEWTGWLVRRWL